MSTLKVDALSSKTTNGDLAITGDGSGVPDIEAGFKVGGTAGVPVSSLRAGTDGQIISWDASGDATAIGPGTDGQVLTSTGAGSPPAFESAAGGGAWTFISSATASSSSALNFTSGIDSTYGIYVWTYENMQLASDNGMWTVRVSTDGGSSWESSDYMYHLHKQTSDGSAYANDFQSSKGHWALTQGTGSQTYEGLDGFFYLGAADGTTDGPRAWWQGSCRNKHGNQIQIIGGVGGQNATSGIWDVNGVSFIHTTVGEVADTITSGTVRMYGIKKS